MSDIEIGSRWVDKHSGFERVVVGLHPESGSDDMVFINGLNGGRVWSGKAEFLARFEPKTPKGEHKKPKHPHYHKDVSRYDTIDVYAVCKIFDVQDTSGCLQHAIKKLLVTGKRGHKDRQTDIQNAIDTLNRLLELEHGKDK